MESKLRLTMWITVNFQRKVSVRLYLIPTNSSRSVELDHITKMGLLSNTFKTSQKVVAHYSFTLNVIGRMIDTIVYPFAIRAAED